jgi:transcriptional regulator of heat shock response
MISPRQQKLLNFLIREFVKTARPIPSALIAKKIKLKASPATIRNDMNDLEEKGFLAQLHTSGGRVPTDRAYRYYVDQLLAEPDKIKTDPKDRKKIGQSLLKYQYNPRALNKAIANALSECTGTMVMAGIAQEAEFFKQGLVQLFQKPEFREIDNAFRLAAFFEGFDLLFQLIEKEFFHTLGSPSGLPIQIMIGSENPFRQMKEQTIMSAKYILPGDVIGSLTLIGPTRMDYEKNIGLIRYVTEQLQTINQ